MKYTLYPAIVVTQAFSGLFHRSQSAPSVTEDEILAIVRLGATAGEITLDESKLVHNIISLENIPVRSIMTPRTVIMSLDAEMTIKEAREAIDGKGLTRFPIYEGDRENIIGYVLSHDLLSLKKVRDESSSLKNLAKQISFVPQTMDSLTLLTKCLSKRVHIFIVIDEFGGVAGLVTLEDVLETILGHEIVDETDREVDLQELARRRRNQALKVLKREKA
jgi:CBS domain containing-hemolysin-like protein